MAFEPRETGPERALRVGILGLVVLACGAASGCGASGLRRFPLRAPVLADTDTRPVAVRCRLAPTDKEKDHVSCAPEPYVSPLVWDGADNLVFRPLSDGLAMRSVGESVNVNALDEVPDSAWFTNRVGVRPFPIDELTRAACDAKQALDGEGVEPGAWVIDGGKSNGATAGFRVRPKGKGKYMFKSDAPTPERPSAASVIGAAAYHAVGFNTSCEQVVFVAPSAFKLTAGLTVTNNSGVTTPFDEKALKKVIDESPHRDGRIRMQASAWLPGYLIGPFRYEHTRADDPNDVIPHEDRRELRGGRLLAAWLNHFDAREQNSMDSWIAENPKGPPDASPGYVRHYYLDTSDSLGSEWDWDGVSRRLGFSYLLDWGDVSTDFLTLGLLSRPWDQVRKQPGQELFAYFDVEHFVPDKWVNEYPNPAFTRMTERDGAWMARILARFTPEMVAALAKMGRFEKASNTEYLTKVLQGRLERILARYLTRVSPITDVRAQGERVCGRDLARIRGVRSAAEFRYTATLSVDGAPPAPLAVITEGEETCVPLGAPASRDRYLVIRVRNGVAPGPLELHVRETGGAYVVAGLDRPAE